MINYRFCKLTPSVSLEPKSPSQQKEKIKDYPHQKPNFELEFQQYEEPFFRTDSVMGIDGHKFTLATLKNKIILD